MAPRRDRSAGTGQDGGGGTAGRVEGRLGSALSAARVGYWNLDLRTDTLDRSPLVDEFYGFVPGEVGAQAQPFRDRHHPDDQIRGRRTFEDALAQGKHHLGHEYRVLLPDGGERWLSLHGEIVVGADGRPDRVTGILMDVTGRRRTEAALERSRERLELAVEATGLGIWDWDVLAGTMTWSARAREIYGFGPDEEVTFEGVRARTHPDDLPSTSAIRLRAFDPAIRSQEAYEYRIVPPDGEIRWVWARGKVVFAQVDGSLRAVRYAGSLLDVTARRRMEDDLRETARRNEVLLAELNHRVKNNLQVVAALLRLQAVRSADAEARGRSLTAHDRVMAIAHAHADEVQVGDPACIDIAAYVARICRHASAGGSSGGVTTEVKGDPGAVLDIDRAVALGLIVNELLANALRHAFPGGRAGRVEVSVDRLREGVRVCVRDDGVGLPDPEGWAKGGGLGGLLVRRLARQVGARIRTVPGPGTCFEVLLPLRA